MDIEGDGAPMAMGKRGGKNDRERRGKDRAACFVGGGGVVPGPRGRHSAGAFRLVVHLVPGGTSSLRQRFCRFILQGFTFRVLPFGFRVTS